MSDFMKFSDGTFVNLDNVCFVGKNELENAYLSFDGNNKDLRYAAIESGNGNGNEILYFIEYEGRYIDLDISYEKAIEEINNYCYLKSHQRTIRY